MFLKHKQSTARKSKKRIPDTFWLALAIIGLSTLPYLHDFITDSDGLKSWVPNLGIESVLTDANGKVHGFSTYRVFLYTLLIFVFACIGWAGWYQSARSKYYGGGIFLVLTSGAYHVALILFDLRKTAFNEAWPKFFVLIGLAVFMGYLWFRQNKLSFKRILVWAVLFIMALLPFFHDIITERGVGLRPWVPNFGIEEMLTNSEGYVRGLGSYRVLVYLFCIYLFSHLGWIGWFFDARGRKFRPFLMVPAALSFYQVVVIAMSWRETEFNSPNIKLYITIGLSVLLAINFYYNNKVSPKASIATENEQS